MNEHEQFKLLNYPRQIFIQAGVYPIIKNTHFENNPAMNDKFQKLNELKGCLRSR